MKPFKKYKVAAKSHRRRGINEYNIRNESNKAETCESDLQNCHIPDDVGFSFYHYQLEFSVYFQDLTASPSFLYCSLLSCHLSPSSSGVDSLSRFVSYMASALQLILISTMNYTPCDRRRSMHGGFIANDAIHWYTWSNLNPRY